jgi:hypothetical protein
MGGVLPGRVDELLRGATKRRHRVVAEAVAVGHEGHSSAVWRPAWPHIEAGVIGRQIHRRLTADLRHPDVRIAGLFRLVGDLLAVRCPGKTALHPERARDLSRVHQLRPRGCGPRGLTRPAPPIDPGRAEGGHEQGRRQRPAPLGRTR